MATFFGTRPSGCNRKVFGLYQCNFYRIITALGTKEFGCIRDILDSTDFVWSDLVLGYCNDFFFFFGGGGGYCWVMCIQVQLHIELMHIKSIKLSCYTTVCDYEQDQTYGELEELRPSS